MSCTCLPDDRGNHHVWCGTPADKIMFVVRAWSIDVSEPSVDELGIPTLAQALDKARSKACDRNWRTVMVTDAWSTCWAQFNMLWLASEQTLARVREAGQ